jgi:putative aldouronate transport system substrate-binding protein
MPNFKAWYEENTQYALNFMSADGALYQFPEQGVDETNRRAGSIAPTYSKNLA